MRSSISLTVFIAVVTTSNAQGQLTKILETGDPIPDSPGLTMGDTIYSARMDHGQIALLSNHSEFGVDKPIQSLLYWQDGVLSKIADDFTPVPGLPGNVLEFNTPAMRANLSIDGSPNPGVDAPEVVFYANYDESGGIARNFAIYRWDAVRGLRLFITPSPTLSYILPGRYADGKLLFSTYFNLGPDVDRGLYILDNGTVSKILVPGDRIPGVSGATFDHLYDDYFFNGHRALGRLNATPIDQSGWWDLRNGGSLMASPSLLIDDDLEASGYHYWQNSIVAIDPTSNPNGSALANGSGTRNGNPSSALLYQSSPGTPFQVIVQRGDPSFGATGFQFWNISGSSVRAGSAVFSATSYDPSFENEIHGIYNWGSGGSTKLLDTNETIDGKPIQSLMFLDRDPASGAILFGARFTDNTLAVYSMPFGDTAISYQTWISDQFPMANGDPAIIGPLKDPDHDRSPNLVEFTLGGLAHTSETNKTTVTTLPGHGGFEYRRRNGLPESITVTPQITSSLAGPWQSGPAVLEEVSVTPDPGDADFSVVRLRALNSESSAFLRLFILSTE